jgi:uncharacterized glyoxalase superfamily protein PhnB
MSTRGIFYVFVYVADFARSKRFYGETLGWTIETNEKVVAGFRFGDAYLVMHDDDRPADARRYGGGMHIGVRVDDVNAEHARLTQRGVRVSALVDQPWGERNFQFDDPDGYTWVFGQPMR